MKEYKDYSDDLVRNRKRLRRMEKRMGMRDENTRNENFEMRENQNFLR